MRGSVVALSAVTTLSLLLAGCADSTTPDRAAAAFESTQPSPSGDSEQVEGSEPEEVIVSAQPYSTQESASSEEHTASEEPTTSEESSSDEQDSTAKSMGSKLCMINNSSQAVSATTVSAPKKILGEIPRGGELCADNFNAFSSIDLARGIAVNGVELMSATINNPFIGLARVVMYQPGNQVCAVNDIAGVGKLGGAKDDGVLRYQLMRVTPYSLKPQQIEYKLVLSDSESPNSSGRPVPCS